MRASCRSMAGAGAAAEVVAAVQSRASSCDIDDTWGFGAAAAPPKAISSLMGSKAACESISSSSSWLAVTFFTTMRMGVSTRSTPFSSEVGVQLRSIARNASGLPSPERRSSESCQSASASDSCVMSIPVVLAIVEK